MSWSDEEIDKMFQSSSDTPVFEYKDEYWKEMEAMLPTQRKPDGLWFATSFLFVVMLLIGMFKTSTVSHLENEQQLVAQQEIEPVEETNVDSDVSKEGYSIISNAGTEKNDVTINTKSNSAKESATYAYNSKENKQSSATLSSYIDTKKNKQSAMTSSSVVSKLNDNNQTDNIIGANELETTNYPLHLEPKLITGIDHLSPLTLNSESSIPHLGVKSVWMPQMYVSAFGGVGNSYLADSKNLLSNYGLGLGVQLRKNNFFTGLELNASFVSMNDVTLNKSYTEYGFGSYRRDYEVNYKQLGSLEGVVRFGYCFNRSQISLGIAPSYVLTSRVNVGQQNEINMMADSKIETTREYYYNYFGGVNRFGLGAQLRYSYSLSSKWQVGLSVNTVLMSKVTDEIGTSRNLPLEGRLSIRRNLNFK